MARHYRRHLTKIDNLIANHEKKTLSAGGFVAVESVQIHRSRATPTNLNLRETMEKS